jgi:hypothetical protein
MASPTESHPKQSHSFDPPEESDWHRMISEAAYYLSLTRGVGSDQSLDDWLVAEQQVRQVIEKSSDQDAKMNDTISQNKSPADVKTPAKETRQAENSGRQASPTQSQRVQTTPQPNNVSRFEKFATTQAGGDGIEGDTLKSGKNIDEKIGANMADRK